MALLSFYKKKLRKLLFSRLGVSEWVNACVVAVRVRVIVRVRMGVNDGDGESESGSECEYFFGQVRLG